MGETVFGRARGSARRPIIVGLTAASLVAGMPSVAQAATDPIVITGDLTCVNVTISGAQSVSGCGIGIPITGQSSIVTTVPAGTQPQIVVRGNAVPSAQEQVANAWAPLMTKALEETAAARKVTADDINQAYGLPEARALLMLQMFDIIRRHAAAPASLTVVEKGAYDALQQVVNRERKAIAAKEQADYRGITANPCGLQDKAGNWITRPWSVPVGDPLAYYKTIAPACRSIWNGITAEYPLPTITQFREWARSQVMEDHYRTWATGKDPNDANALTSRLDVIPNSILSASPWLTESQALGEAKREFTTGMASLVQGFAYLTASGADLSSIPAGARTPAEDEFLQDIVSQVGEFSADHLRDAAIDLAGGLLEIFVEFGGEEISTFAANLSGIFEAGLGTFGAIAGATAALAIEITFLVGQQKARDGIAADQAAAASPPSIDVLATTEDGRHELMNALMLSILPDNGAAVLKQAAGTAADPAPGDLLFTVAGAGDPPGRVSRSRNLSVVDWAREGLPSILVSTSRGWLTKADIRDFTAANGSGPYAAPDTKQVTLGTRRYSPVINFVDWNGSYWRAWLKGDTFLQTRYADPVAGSVEVIKAVEGLGGPCPPGSSFGVTTISASVLGPSCVIGTGTHFRTDLKQGDSIQIGQEIKVVDAIYSDTAFTVADDFEDVLTAGQTVMKVLPLGPNCTATKQCVTSPTIHYRSRSVGSPVDGQWIATISGNQAPAIAPTFDTTLTPAYLAADGSASAFAIGAGRPITFRANASDPDPNDHVRINWTACELENGQSVCTLSTTIPLTNAQAAGASFTYAFRSTGRQTVTLDVRDDFGGLTSQTIALTVVPSAPKWEPAASPSFASGQFGSFTFATQPGSPAPRVSVDSASPLPAGLTLTDNGDGTATIAGTPSTAGHYTVTLRAQTTVDYTQANGTVSTKQLSDVLPLDITVSGPQTIEGFLPRLWPYGRPLPVDTYISTTSGLPVVVTVAPESATKCQASGPNGHTLTMIGRGAPFCTYTLTQPGDGAVQPADPITRTITVLASSATAAVTGTAQYSDAPVYTVGTVDGLYFSDRLDGAITACDAVGMTVDGGNVAAPAGDYPIQSCTGLTNINYLIHYSGSVAVTPEDATLANTTQAANTPGVAAMTAVITPNADGTPGDLSKATVDFLLFGSKNSTDSPDWAARGVAVNLVGQAASTLSGLPPDTYRLIIRTTPGNAYYQAKPVTSTLTVRPTATPPVITSQPRDVRVPHRGTVTVTATATGFPEPSAQWQRSNDRGRSWRDIPGATTTSLIISRRQKGGHDYQVRVVFTNSAGTATSTPARVRPGDHEDDGED